MKRIIQVVLVIVLCLSASACSEAVANNSKKFTFRFSDGTENLSVAEVFAEREKEENSGRNREAFDNRLIGTTVSGKSKIVKIERSWSGSYSTPSGRIPYAYSFYIYLEGDVVLCLSVSYNVSGNDYDLINDDSAYEIDLYEGDVISFSAPADDSLTWENNLRLELADIDDVNPREKLGVEQIQGVNLV